MERAAARMERWPVGPVAAVMLGGAMAFFCWAMPGPVVQAWSDLLAMPTGSPGRTVLIAAPALIATTLTWLVFRRIDKAAQPADLADEGDDHEDWLTPGAAQDFTTLVVRPDPVVKPLILDAIVDFPPALAPEAETDDELLLDHAAEPESPPTFTEAPIAELMERLAAEMAPGGVVVVDATPVSPAERLSAPAPARARADQPDDAALRATIADLQRMAAPRG
ncbi:hypothetical protein SAMN06295912_11482 [Sphingomonas laterariae]|uniref:Uncharacterized protein n=1 Tax=Edaphosphingomonas laterariae TaxID=861865 RepID=A0A239H127_9SPHN|nr:hypothetical protein [Sphingomonas laterariae]SNS75087.1 hypothetical protein SAMN06295912_11482 [Sphingomonas laterariae]